VRKTVITDLTGLKNAWSWTVCLVLQCLASGFRNPFFSSPNPFCTNTHPRVLHNEEPHLRTLFFLTAVLQKYSYCTLSPPPQQKKTQTPNRKTNPQTKSTMQTDYDLTWQTKSWQWHVLSGCCQLRTGSQPAFFLLHEDLTVTPSTGPRGIRAET